MQVEPTPAPLVRHSKTVRITHWITTASFVALVISGTAILLAHPRLYWGEVGNDHMAALVELPLPRIYGPSGWGRSLHFLAAWIMVLIGSAYVVSGFARRHFQRKLVPTREERRWPNLRQDFANHFRADFPAGRFGSSYGTLQKLAYLAVIFVGLPMVIFTGLAMSPAMTAAYPVLSSVFGGHQTARTLHFFTSLALLLFVVVHVVMVVRTGFWRQMRAMIFGGNIK